MSEPAAAITGRVFLLEAKPAVSMRPPSRALRIVPRGVAARKDASSESCTALGERRFGSPGLKDRPVLRHPQARPRKVACIPLTTVHTVSRNHAELPCICSAICYTASMHVAMTTMAWVPVTHVRGGCHVRNQSIASSADSVSRGTTVVHSVPVLPSELRAHTHTR